MFPIRDDNPTLRTPVVTVGLIALNAAVWVLIQGMGTNPALPRSVCELGLIPGEFLHRLPPGTEVSLGPFTRCILGAGPVWLTPLSSMFLHGGWFHLIGNMWFLWVFGDNIEDSMGHARYAIFYLTCGVAAALLQVFVSPASGIPMVGASGAISGVMGGYLVLYPRVRVFALLFLGFFVTSIALPAWTMLLYWAAIQFVSGLFGLLSQDQGGVAFWAHTGGFVAGLVLIKLFARPADVMAHRSQRWEPRRLVGR
jgi:membrane associated rhomboid family serine protease